MLRGDNIVCGTSTTGTGTLTLAASPGPPGGIDFDVFARAAGIGFGNSAVILASYTIIEYTDSTFATMKSHEKGIGTLTLGGSSGITNCTLARTTVQTTATSLNSQPATQNVGGTGFSIATAANVLVFIGASPADVPAYDPYFETSAIAPANSGVAPVMWGGSTNANNSPSMTHLVDIYAAFEWRIPMLVKRITVNIFTAYTGGTTNLYGRIYQINTSGRPGKLLYDFGLLGSAGTSLNSTGTVQSGAAGSGFFLPPGHYILDLLPSFTGGSGTPVFWGTPNIISPGNFGVNTSLTQLVTSVIMTATSGTVGTAPDPANVTGYAAGGNLAPLFSLSPT